MPPEGKSLRAGNGQDIGQRRAAQDVVSINDGDPDLSIGKGQHLNSGQGVGPLVPGQIADDQAGGAGAEGVIRRLAHEDGGIVPRAAP